MNKSSNKSAFCPQQPASECSSPSRPSRSEWLRKVRVAVCGHLPSACEYLSRQGVLQIDQYSDAVNIRCESDYHLILVYAPQGEGLVNTTFTCKGENGEANRSIPIRLLNEPCCHSALLELKLTVYGIANEMKAQAANKAP